MDFILSFRIPFAIGMVLVDHAKSARAAATGDDIIAAAQDLLSAKSALHKLEQDALDNDPQVAAAKAALDAAIKAAGGIRLAVLLTIKQRRAALFRASDRQANRRRRMLDARRRGPESCQGSAS